MNDSTGKIWMVEISGDEMDVGELLRFNQPPEIEFENFSEKLYLRSKRFNSLEKGRDVLSVGAELLKTINGIAKLQIDNWKNVDAVNVVRRSASGKTDRYLITESASFRFRFGDGTMTHRAADGTVLSSSTTRPAVNPIAALAEGDKSVEKALRFFGFTHTFVNLFKVFEIIRDDVGGESQIPAEWVSAKKIELFRRTANHPEASGDHARHGVLNTEPPNNPMKLSDATSLIRKLLHLWIARKLR